MHTPCLLVWAAWVFFLAFLACSMETVWTVRTPALPVGGKGRGTICTTCGGTGCQFCEDEQGDDLRRRHQLRMELKKSRKERERAERERVERERKEQQSLQIRKEQQQLKSKRNIIVWAEVVRKTLILDTEMQYTAPMVALGNIEKILDFFCREFFSVEKPSFHCAFCHHPIPGNDSRSLRRHQSENKRCKEKQKKSKGKTRVTIGYQAMVLTYLSASYLLVPISSNYFEVTLSQHSTSVIAAFDKCACTGWCIFLEGRRRNQNLMVVDSLVFYCV